MNAEHGITIQVNGYNVTIEKVGKVWRAQVNGLTICACSTRQATKSNAEFLLHSPLHARITFKQAEQRAA